MNKQRLIICNMASSVYDIYMTFAAALLCVYTGSQGALLQNYTVYNRHQCQRLCWYWTSCIAFSVPDDVTVVKGEVNCLLHNNDPSTASPGWLTVLATNTGIHHGCRHRPCSSTEFCIPLSLHLNGQHRCVAVPVDCGVPTVPANARISWTGTTPGHKATLICEEDFVATPKNADTRITCRSNGTWSTFQADCRQVSYSGSLQVPFLAELPRPMTLGWEACIKGTFLGNGQFVVNFLSDQENYPNLPVDSYVYIIAQLAFRDSLDDVIQSVLYSEKTPAGWTELGRYGGNPLAGGEFFALSLHLNASCLTMTLHGRDFSVCAPWDGRVQLLATVYLGIARSLQLDYVNLISAQDCS